jgi:phosphoglycerate dehydrogenase-like enzyme
MLPPNDKLTICFAHVAYRLHERFSALNTGINNFAVRDFETLEKRVGEADVLVISGLWQNCLLDRATKLRFVQAIGAGTDQFPRDNWQSAASALPARAVSTTGPSRNTRWPSSWH